MGATFSTDTINTRDDLESIIIKYILQSSDKDVEFIDNNLYRNNTINLLSNILNKYVKYEIIDEIFYHVGADDNMIELDINMLHYSSDEIPIDMRLKCKFLAEFYYEIYVVFNKIKNLIIAVTNLINVVETKYNKYQQIGDIYDDNVIEEIEALEFRINNLQLIRFNFYHILGDLFVKRDSYVINKDISLKNINNLQNIIDFEINTFSNKIAKINRCE